MRNRSRNSPDPAGIPSKGIAEIVLNLARSQYGVVSRSQLADLGIPGSALDHALKTLRLVPLFRGVYGLGHDVIGIRGWWTAAILSGGPESVLSHSTAAAVWGLAQPRGTVEIVRPFNRQHRPNRKFREPARHESGLFVHRSRRLPSVDLTTHDGFPVTSVARTLLDQAPFTSEKRLRSMVADADHRRILDWTRLREITGPGPGRKGIRLLRQITNEWDPRFAATKFEFEK